MTSFSKSGVAEATDRPQIVIFPPLIVIATLVLGCALQWLMPLGLLVNVGHTWRIVVGVPVLIVGLLAAASGRVALMRHGTNVNPLRPAVALVTEGIYRWTRNPMYVGISTALLGIALIFAVDWLPIVLLPGLFILHFGVVLREEQYLDRKFGETYRRYKLSTPRYLWLV